MSVQEAAAASQKLTCPGFSAVALAFTVAVIVTTVPPATEDTALPPEVRESVVTVAWAAIAGCEPPHHARQTIASAQKNELRRTDRRSPVTVRRKRMPFMPRVEAGCPSA